MTRVLKYFFCNQTYKIILQRSIYLMHGAAIGSSDFRKTVINNKEHQNIGCKVKIYVELISRRPSINIKKDLMYWVYTYATRNIRGIECRG